MLLHALHGYFEATDARQPDFTEARCSCRTGFINPFATFYRPPKMGFRFATTHPTAFYSGSHGPLWEPMRTFRDVICNLNSKGNLLCLI